MTFGSPDSLVFAAPNRADATVVVTVVITKGK